MKIPTIRFGLPEAQAAADAWNFSCGPAALCALLDMTPAEIRPHLPGFEAKGYTSPTDMAKFLDGLNVRWRRLWESPLGKDLNPYYPQFGLVRLQWSGPWTRPEVPIRARYCFTHWIAHAFQTVRAAADMSAAALESGAAEEQVRLVYDINAMAVGGWIPWQEWANQLVPWLLREGVPRADGKWYPTHCWEIEGRGGVPALAREPFFDNPLQSAGAIRPSQTERKSAPPTP